MNILFTICARAGSKGVKSKNSKRLNGVPLVYYTLSVYKQFQEKYDKDYGIIELAINTDSRELKQQCENTKIPFSLVPRKDALGGDKVAKADVICDTLERMEIETKEIFDIVVDLDLTSPLRKVNDVQGCIQKLLHNPAANVAFSVTHSRRLPYFNMVVENDSGYLERVIKTNYVTRQEAPPCYDMNASIYAYRRIPLLNTKEQNVFDGNSVGWIMKDTAVLDIDSEEDFEMIGILADYFFKTDKDFAKIVEYIPGILHSK